MSKTNDIIVAKVVLNSFIVAFLAIVLILIKSKFKYSIIFPSTYIFFILWFIVLSVPFIEFVWGLIQLTGDDENIVVEKMMNLFGIVSSFVCFLFVCFLSAYIENKYRKTNTKEVLILFICTLLFIANAGINLSSLILV